MTLWLLRPIEGLHRNNPWDPWFGRAFGFVVRAETEEAAREMASQAAGRENSGVYGDEDSEYEFTLTCEPWKDAQYSTCVDLDSLLEGDAEILMKDLRMA